MKGIALASGNAWDGAERGIATLLASSRDVSEISNKALLFNEGRLADTLRDIGVLVRVIPQREPLVLEIGP